MKALTLLLVGLSTTLLSGCPGPEELPAPSRTELTAGLWRAVLTLPGGELPFGLEIETGAARPILTLINGEERVTTTDVQFVDGRLLGYFPAFNTRIDVSLDQQGDLTGNVTLIKKRGEKQVIPMHAQAGRTFRFVENGRDRVADFSGRWETRFVDDDGVLTVAVGEFRQQGSHVTGTFLTPVGDYRYLAGDAVGDKLYLSTFDGSHAFLFVATMMPDKTLKGDFWSGLAWHERWKAVANPDARLPDADTLTFLKPGYDRFDFAFSNTSGERVSLSDPRYDGKVVIVTLAGSWCPNCHDEAAFLAPLHRRLQTEGLDVIGLMFEHFGDFETAAAQIEKFRDKFDIEFELLVAGISDKAQAAETLPMLNHVLAFPTMIVVDRSGAVRRIHTGFSGPGTAGYYETFRREFTAFIEQLLAEKQEG